MAKLIPVDEFDLTATTTLRKLNIGVASIFTIARPTGRVGDACH